MVIYGSEGGRGALRLDSRADVCGVVTRFFLLYRHPELVKPTLPTTIIAVSGLTAGCRHSAVRRGRGVRLVCSPAYCSEDLHNRCRLLRVDAKTSMGANEGASLWSSPRQGRRTLGFESKNRSVPSVNWRYHQN